MKLNDYIKGRRALVTLSAQKGIGLAEVKQEIQTAIDTAWADPMRRTEQQRLFPDGKPTPEVFVGRLAKHIS